MERKNNRNKGNLSLLGSHFKFFFDSYFTEKHRQFFFSLNSRNIHRFQNEQTPVTQHCNYFEPTEAKITRSREIGFKSQDIEDITTVHTGCQFYIQGKVSFRWCKSFHFRKREKLYKSSCKDGGHSRMSQFFHRPCMEVTDCSFCDPMWVRATPPPSLGHLPSALFLL